MSNAERVQAWRKRAKQKLVQIAGGKCQLCGYDKCIIALEFHHIDPTEKDFAVTGSRDTRKFSIMIEEIRKCILVCANCHREIHYGLIDNGVLQKLRFIDEVLVNKYTIELEESKALGRFQKGESRRKRLNVIAEFKEQHPYTDHRIKKVDWSQHNVFNLLEEHTSYEAVGRLLGVTGAAVKRRVKHLERKNNSEVAQRQ